MENNQYIEATVSLCEHRPRYTVSEAAWSHITQLADIWGKRNNGALVRVQSDRFGPRAQLIEDCGAVICRPTIDTITNTSHWYVTPASTTETEYEDDTMLGLEDGEDFVCEWISQTTEETDDGTPLTSALVTMFDLCDNPFFLVGIRRQALPSDYECADDNEPETVISIGGTDSSGVRIRLPYRRASYVQVYDADGENGAGYYPFDWTTGGLNFGPEKDGEERLVIAVGCVMGRLYVWNVGDPNPIASLTWQRGDTDSWLWVKQAPMQVTHNNGQFSTMMRPLILAPVQISGPMLWKGDSTSGYAYTNISVRGYSCDGNLIWKNPVTSEISGNALINNTYGSLVWADGTYTTDGHPDAGIVCVGVPENAATYTPDMYTAWLAELVPLSHVDTFTRSGVEYSVTTQTTPALVSVDLWQSATLVDGGEPAEETSLTDDGVVHEIHVTAQEGMATTRCEITLHNRREDPTYMPGILRQINVTDAAWSAYEYTGDTLGPFWTVEPTVGARHTKIFTFDALSLLALRHCLDDHPAGDGQLISDYIASFLHSLQIGPEMRDLEDTGLYFHLCTDWSKRLWYPQRAATALEYIAEVQDKAAYGGAIWCENGVLKTGCKYCGAKRTSSDYLTHTGYDSTGCVAADVARAGAAGIDFYVAGSGAEMAAVPSGGVIIEATDVSREDAAIEQSFANVVDVVGTNEQGLQVRSLMADYDSLFTPTDPAYTGGYIISYADVSSDVQTAGEATTRAARLLDEHGKWPLYVSVECPYVQNLSRGMVIGIKGWDNLGIDDCKFRVLSYEHIISRHEVAKTFMRAIYIGDIS